MARFDLQPHPDHISSGVESVSVDIYRQADGSVWLEYAVARSSTLLLPQPQFPERADDLWQTTCFELFFRPAGGEAYVEFNFSPSFRWAAYQFSSYRAGRRDLLSAVDPEIEVFERGEPYFFLAAEPWPADIIGTEGMFALSAVIEEIDGTKSYWALAHAPGPPDFHNPACFAATLPPPAAP